MSDTLNRQLVLIALNGLGTETAQGQLLEAAAK